MLIKDWWRSNLVHFWLPCKCFVALTSSLLPSSLFLILFELTYVSDPHTGMMSGLFQSIASINT